MTRLTEDRLREIAACGRHALMDGEAIDMSREITALRSRLARAEAVVEAAEREASEHPEDCSCRVCHALRAHRAAADDKSTAGVAKAVERPDAKRYSDDGSQVGRAAESGSNAGSIPALGSTPSPPAGSHAGLLREAADVLAAMLGMVSAARVGSEALCAPGESVVERAHRLLPLLRAEGAEEGAA